jgi:tRNA threonylcarbamoyladenosine biosynthesis protein TsaB
LKILSIDTSTPAGSIVLSLGAQVIAEINVESSETHSSRLLTGLDYLLKSTGVGLATVDAFAVITGPGSFTGIRIGLTVVKGLAETSCKPVIPVTAFDAWTSKFPARQGFLVPLIDARRGEVYASVFERRGIVVRSCSPAVVARPAEVLKQITAADALFVGNAAIQYETLITDTMHPNWTVGRSDLFLGRALAEVACSRAAEGAFVSAQELQAYYLRKSDAELNWKER